jgi:hypothetical protein
MNSLNTLKIDLYINYIRKSTSCFIEKEFCVHYKTSRFLLLRKILIFIARKAGNHKYATQENAAFLNIKSDGAYDYQYTSKD